MEQNAKYLLEKGHETITQFLSSHSKHLYKVVKDYKEWRLLNLVMNTQPGVLFQKDVAKELGILEPSVSKLKNKLNENLDDFSESCGIKPVIQLYFQSSKVHKAGAHLSCSYASNPSSSDAFIFLNELIDILARASKLISIKQHEADAVATKIDDVQVGPFIPLDERLAPKRGRYTTKHDFDSGVYYRDDKLHNEVVRILETNRRCLIEGPPGCGKTTFGLAIAYGFSMDGQNIAYYCDLSYESVTETWTETLRAYGGNVLVVLDNVHCKYEDVNNLLCDIGRHKCKLLLITRKVERRLTLSVHPDRTHSFSYFYILGEENAIKTLAVTQTMLLNVIGRLPQHGRIKEEQVGDVSRLLDKCQGDLHILRLYLEAWEGKEQPGYLSDMNKETILEDVYHHYLKEESYKDQLLKISALSQLEIPVDSKWIKKGLDTLLAEGLLEPDLKDEVQDEVQDDIHITWLRVYHSTPARYFLLAAAHNPTHPMRSVEQFTLTCLRDYLSTCPYNFFEVFRHLYANDRLQWYSSLLSDANLVQSAKQILRRETLTFVMSELPMITGFVLSLIRLGTTEDFRNARDLVEVLLKKISVSHLEQFGVKGLTLILTLLRKVKIDPTSLLAGLDFGTLGEHVMETKTRLGTLRNFFELVRKAGMHNELVNDFCPCLGFSALGERAKRDQVGLATITNFLNSARKSGVSDENIVQFCERLNFHALAEQANKDKVGLTTISHFVELLLNSRVPKPHILQFWEALNLCALGERAKSRKVGNASIAIFIRHVVESGANRRMLESFCKGLGVPSLAQKISENRLSLSALKHLIRAELEQECR